MKRHPSNTFSEPFMDLVQKMMANDPKERPTIEEIAVHPWVKLPTYSKTQMNQEFKKRHSVLEKLAERKEQQP